MNQIEKVENLFSQQISHCIYNLNKIRCLHTWYVFTIHWVDGLEVDVVLRISLNLKRFLSQQKCSPKQRVKKKSVL